MATLQEQIEKARIALSQAKDLQAAKESKTKDTRYGKFDPKSAEGKAALADLTVASKKVKEAQAYYDNLQAAFKKEQEKKAITGDTGVSEEKQAAQQGLTVEELRAKNQAALDESQAKKDAANQSAVDQTQQASLSQFKNTLVADETQLKAVQADLKKNFPKFYSGGINGLKDWLKTQAAIEAIYTERGGLPKALQGTDLRTFLISPPPIDFGTGAGGAGGAGLSGSISDPTRAAALIKDVIKTNLGREATVDEITKLTKVLNTAERKNPYKTVNGITTGGLDKTEFLTQEVQKLPEYSTKKAEKESLNSQSILATARANGINLSQDQLNNYLTQVKNGTDIKVINNSIRQAAGLGMPDSVKKLLAEGTDLDTIYSPYKTTMASLLEIPSDRIDLNDTTLRSAIGPDKEMPLYEFKKALKKDTRWQYTDNARKEVSDNVLRVLKDFGFQG